MIESYVAERFTALFAPTYNVASSENLNAAFNLEGDNTFRPIDGNDPRNFLLNLLDHTEKNLKTFTPRLQGLAMVKTYGNANGVLTVTYATTFRFQSPKANLLVDDQALESIIPF
jgi:hypothetical protein